MKRRSMLCLLALGLGLASASALAASNDELRIATTQEFENPNPLIMQMLATSYIYRMTGRTLNILDADGKVAEQLATRTPTLENGLAKWVEVGGRRTIQAQWEIKAAAKWGDGTPVTGHDVRFSWEVARADTVSVGEKEVYTDIEAIDVDPDNPKKFTFTYSKAKWDFYKMFSFFIVPRHLEGPVFKKHGAQPMGYEKNSLYVVNPGHPGLYNGPYRPTEVALGSHVTLAPNPTFYGRQPAIKKIIVKLIPNTATLEANLRSGAVQMVSVLGFALDQAIAFEKRAAGSPFRVNFRDSLFYEHIDLNLDSPILKDRQVRHALVAAIDRQALCQALFAGKQQPALHNVAPLDPWFTDDPAKIVVHRHSTRRAARSLEAAGWKLGAGGYRYRDGKKLALRLMTTAGDKTRENVQALLQAQWKKAGVEINIKNEPARVYFGETVRRRKFPAMAMFAWLSSPENSPRSTFHSQSIPTAANGWSGQNATGWRNPEVDRLIDQLEQEFDAAKRLPLAHRILYHYTNDVPVIPLYYRAYNSVTPVNLRGYRLTGHQFGSTNHVEDWRLE